MRTSIWRLFFLLLAASLVSCSTTVTEEDFDATKAWEELEGVLRQQYAYLDRPDAIEETISSFKARAVGLSSISEFRDLSQSFLRHFLDPHLNLGPYDENDFSVFPTGSDIRAVYENEAFFIEDVKAGGAADLAGIRPGSELVEIDGLQPQESVEKVLGVPFGSLSVDDINYGVNIALGGYRNRERDIVLKEEGGRVSYPLAASYQAINELKKGPPVTHKKLGEFGYIRFNNSLGNSETVDAFKDAISSLLETKALIIDLRDTPSGGNTGVAEPVLGHFVENKTAYQQYQIQEKGVSYSEDEMRTAYAQPKQPHYGKPFVLLAGRWTGSMGEGMAIGFDAIGATEVIGAPMADLLGGIKTLKLKESNSWMELGFERMYHVDGSFREDFEPSVMISPADRDANGDDPSLSLALSILKKLPQGSR